MPEREKHEDCCDFSEKHIREVADGDKWSRWGDHGATGWWMNAVDALLEIIDQERKIAQEVQVSCRSCGLAISHGMPCPGWTGK